ncbi:MAG: PIN domain-containing protein [Gammaproteobacteria bacterium]|nr:PIN domain-containing protein [Gammaproteobacteria bacterium]
MNVYIESNFVLELAFLQEQSSSCEEILRLAEGEHIELVVPAYALIEPYETLVRRKKGRQHIDRELSKELQQIARNEEFKNQLEGFRDITALLLRAVDEDEKRLKSVRSRLLRFARVIPMETSVLTSAENYEDEHELSPQDAHIYSAVLDHLRQTEDRASCFLNKNRKDFDDPNLVDELTSYGCKLLPSFDRGREYILSETG